MAKIGGITRENKLGLSLEILLLNIRNLTHQGRGQVVMQRMFVPWMIGTIRSQLIADKL